MADEQENSTPKVIYILYLVGILLPVMTIVGVVVAYVFRGEASNTMQSHYTFQIRTFWISLLLQIIGWLTLVVGIGWLILLIWLIWLIVRCVKGLRIVSKNLPYPNPKTWLLG